MPQQPRSQATLDFLLQATDEVVTQLGFEAATIPELARRAGMSAPAIYRYFPTKDALFAAWAEKKWLDGVTRIASVAVDLHTRRVPPAMVVATLVDLVVDMIGDLAIVFRGSVGHHTARAEQQHRHLTETSAMLAAMLEERRTEEPGTIRSGDLRLRCLLVNVMVAEGAAAAAASDPERFRSRVVHRELVHAALAWLLPTTPGETDLIGYVP